MQYYIKAFVYYAVFNTRASRKEFWYFVLFHLIVAILLGILGVFLEAKSLIGVYALFALVPAIAISVRRLHDVGKSGWWYAINLVPVLGQIVFLYFVAQEGEDGPNKYGQDPLVITDTL